MTAPKIVGVIFSRADLQRALRMRKPPDFFELRLDAFADCPGQLRPAISHLPAPLIITARHPREGGCNDLPASRRRDLLLEFLPYARYVDVELRSVGPLDSVLRSASQKKVATIISFHDFKTTPPPRELDDIAARARSLGAAIIKVATRTDRPAHFDQLLRFFRGQDRTDVVAMGLGRLGRKSRFEFIRLGCALNYAHLGSPTAAGQLSIAEIRRFARRAGIVSS
jgi:3-dehydroquinate dehydratase-1